jgi:hypothetical protein
LPVRRQRVQILSVVLVPSTRVRTFSRLGFQVRRVLSDMKIYNLSWAGKSAGLPAIEASEGFLAPIFGRVEQQL